MTKLNKVAGAIEQCPNCKTQIVCVQKPAQGEYPAKLQWCDKSGNAHYNFDFATKTTSCKEVVAAKEISMGSLGLEVEITDKIEKETEQILKLQLARIACIEKGLKKRGIPYTGAFVGMLYNQQMESLRN
jgi:hypothetical protein